MPPGVQLLPSSALTRPVPLLLCLTPSKLHTTAKPSTDCRSGPYTVPVNTCAGRFASERRCDDHDHRGHSLHSSAATHPVLVDLLTDPLFRPASLQPVLFEHDQTVALGAPSPHGLACHTIVRPSSKEARVQIDSCVQRNVGPQSGIT